MPRIIAFYLPQYHPFKENDEWWGKGFTEWSNVVKARPLFKGHYQPKIPTDLGFYDLRVPEVREEQARMAREAGIEGFCYWHYWFHGHELMERPFWEVVQSGKPDFPFCIGWANETWKSKMWNKDGSLAEGTKTLIEQIYSEEDDKVHFQKLLPAFKDRRYILVDGKPLVFIHRGKELPAHTIAIWNQLAKETGFSGVHFVGRVNEPSYSSLEKDLSCLYDKGFDALSIPRLGLDYSIGVSLFSRLRHQFKSVLLYHGCRRVVKYEDDLKNYVDLKYDTQETVYPAIYPNWDHSPRSGKNGLIVVGSNPQLFKDHVVQVMNAVHAKQPQHQIIFLKSWNEWGEGNYMEPDTKFGNGYLLALKTALESGQ